MPHLLNLNALACKCCMKRAGDSRAAYRPRPPCSDSLAVHVSHWRQRRKEITASNLGAAATLPLVTAAAGGAGRAVAVKVFKAEASPDGRAEDEIAVTCAVDHPHLIRVLGLVAQPHAMIVDRVMGSRVSIRYPSSPSPATRAPSPRCTRALRS